jgi:hypothetical protein
LDKGLAMAADSWPGHSTCSAAETINLAISLLTVLSASQGLSEAKLEAVSSVDISLTTEILNALVDRDVLGGAAKLLLTHAQLLEQIGRNDLNQARAGRQLQVFTISAPLLDRYGRAIAALGVMGHTRCLNTQITTKLTVCVIEGASKISGQPG